MDSIGALIGDRDQFQAAVHGLSHIYSAKKMDEALAIDQLDMLHTLQNMVHLVDISSTPP